MPSQGNHPFNYHIRESIMERNRDRPTNLPAPIVESFQSLAISSTIVDFGPEFASNKTPEELAASINQCLQLYNGNKISRFRLAFCPLEMFLPDIESWIQFATSMGVEEIDLDFSQGFNRWTDEFNNGGNLFKLPNCLYYCESLTHLCLKCCDFHPPQDFTAFRNLRSLSLTYVKIPEDVLQNLLVFCQTLESLNLHWTSLLSIKVSGPHLHLKKLVVVPHQDALEVFVSAPELQSFIYSGMYMFEDVNVPSLVDALISSLNHECCEPEHDYVKLLSDLAHVEILTVCTATLMRVSTCGFLGLPEEDLPVPLPNLRELQLLMELMREEELGLIYDFFRFCPSPILEKLFIQLPNTPEDLTYRSCLVTEEPSNVVFNHLKAIKLSNFKGCRSEMRLVRFLLERATVLEKLVLVAPPKLEVKETTGMELDESVLQTKSEERMDIAILRGHITSLPKASLGANIVLFERSPVRDGFSKYKRMIRH